MAAKKTASKKPAAKPVWTQNLWTTCCTPSPKKPWSLERQIKEAKLAGFDAITTWANPDMRPLLEKYELRLMGYFASAKASEFKKAIKQQKDSGAENINVQLGDEDTPVAKSIELAIKLLDEAEKQDIPVFIEMHRDTSTETPEKTFAIAEGYEKARGKPMPICWDHSHWNVVKHYSPDRYTPQMLTGKQPNKKLHQLPWIFHFRPANGHHCQVPVTNGKGQLGREFKEWLPFAEDLMAYWLEGPRPTGEMWICPELGPNEHYGLEIFPDVWEDCQRCLKELKKAWNRAKKRVG